MITLTLAAGVATPVLAAPLVDSFALGDGSGATYTLGSVAGQDGGVGWEPGSAWSIPAAADNGTALVEETISPDGQLTLTAAGTQDGGRIVAARTYSEQTPDAGYQLQFNLTLNTLVDANNSSEYIQFFDRPVGGDDFGSNGTWLIRGTLGTWKLYSFAPLVGSSFGSATVIDTAIEMVAGHTYAFEVSIDGQGEWSATVDDIDDAEAAFAQSAMGFRSADSVATRGLNFGIRDATSGETDLGGSMSIDDLVIIPEPGSLGLIALGSLLGVARRRRR
jgi:hypothetical protein